MMIEVFKTDVSDEKQASDLRHLLLRHFPTSRINFDLHDCDKILRIEGADFSSELVQALVKNSGFACDMLV